MGLAILGSVMTNRFASQLMSQVSAGLREAMPADQLSALAHNPQALVSPEAEAQLKAGLSSAGPQSAELLEQLLTSLKVALSDSLSEVFLISLLVVAVAWIATIFLKEIPLRRGTPRTEVEERHSSP